MQLFKTLKYSFFIFIIFKLILTGCNNDVNRDNPLDPKSSKFKNYGTIQGQVFSYYQPYKQINNAEIIIIPGHYLTFTDQNGEFIVNNLPANEYTIYISHSDYVSDSLKVNLKPGTINEHQFNLNGMPKITNYQIISGCEHRWFPQHPRYILIVNAEVTDIDGSADIFQVRLILPEFNFSDTLKLFSTNPTIFKAIYTEKQLPTDNFQQILGYPLFIEIDDTPGAICKSSSIYVTRIVEEVPIPLSPAGWGTVASFPLLKWQNTIANRF